VVVISKLCFHVEKAVGDAADSRTFSLALKVRRKVEKFADGKAGGESEIAIDLI
jgi:hypothetical protein